LEVPPPLTARGTAKGGFGGFGEFAQAANRRRDAGGEADGRNANTEKIGLFDKLEGAASLRGSPFGLFCNCQLSLRIYPFPQIWL
jgi:hypothetical protein